MRLITISDIERWKSNTIDTAIKFGYNRSILNSINTSIEIRVSEIIHDKLNLFGYCLFYKNRILLIVYSRNLSSNGLHYAMDCLRNACFSTDELIIIFRTLSYLKSEEFFELYNQSCMDHEIIGHIYNNRANKRYDEISSRETQFIFASKRAELMGKRLWKKSYKILPILLGCKKI